MSTTLLNDRDLHFLLYEFLNTAALLERPKYQEHNIDTLNSSLDTAKTIAERYFANHNAKGDANEPVFDGEKVTLIPETKAAWDAFAQAGFLAAGAAYEDGGSQLPEIIVRGAMAYLNAANIATAAYPFLTLGAANLIRTFGSLQQKEQFLSPMMTGRFAGTMALTEPNQGSALGDITTRAIQQNDGSYRVSGQKMFISGGDQSITENIIHLVLARVEGAPIGVKGISLFIVPKFLLNADQSIGEKNDVALSGLLHKMGYRNATSTVLNFGERGGATGYLIGQENLGLKYMFQMMNEARIGVGLGAACLAYQGFNYSLDYARQRPQGRLPSCRDPKTDQIDLIQHADVRRMLLAQKSYCEGSLALCLYATSLFEDSNTADTEPDRQRAATLLDLLTPVVKSFPSKYGVLANDLAIQILGGAGYIREHPVEQLLRDNRLNPIHEGAEAIHGIDILGRKILGSNLADLSLLSDEINNSIATAESYPEISQLATDLQAALTRLLETSKALQTLSKNDMDLALANATLYLDMFGRVVIGWIWLRQAEIALGTINRSTPKNRISKSDENFYRGKIQTARYYIERELPVTEQQAQILSSANSVSYDMLDEWF
ncbi:MAG: acyl-CoA dehydrogenase [Pseudomonadales bacterium]|nr:acyl-CoA dehydrogenase [Pseudomonadales bacterium]